MIKFSFEISSNRESTRKEFYCIRANTQTSENNKIWMWNLG